MSNEQSPQTSNPLLQRMPSKEPIKETPAQAEEPQATDNVDVGTKGYPRPELKVTFSPDAEAHGPSKWTLLYGASPDRSYKFERMVPGDDTDVVKATMDGYQIDTDPNVTTGFNSKPSSDPKRFGDTVLMVTSRENKERIDRRNFEAANEWKKPRHTRQEQIETESKVEFSHEKFEAVDAPEGSGKKTWAFPNNPLGK